jgi:hypothetical protein
MLSMAAAVQAGRERRAISSLELPPDINAGRYLALGVSRQHGAAAHAVLRHPLGLPCPRAKGRWPACGWQLAVNRRDYGTIVARPLTLPTAKAGGFSALRSRFESRTAR